MTKTRSLFVVGLFVFALVAGATWAFAQEGSGIIHACVKNANGQITIVAEGAECGNNEHPLSWSSGEGGGGGNGGGVFTWQSSAGIFQDACLGAPNFPSGCGEEALNRIGIPMPSDGHLTALAIHPFSANLLNPVRLTVLVNGSPSALIIDIPPGATAAQIATISVAVQAGDLVVLKTDRLFDPNQPYPEPYPGGNGYGLSYNASLQFVSD